jgi:hypothetical protein
MKKTTFLLSMFIISVAGYAQFAPYCGPLAFPQGNEPISLVNFAGINNATSATVAGASAHENFTTIFGSVTAGQTYQITVKGNTDGDYPNLFTVYIDWNRDGDFLDIGEEYQLPGEIRNSTGADTKQLIGNILVPSDVTTGTTRMRVIKKYLEYSDSCNSVAGSFGDYGQAEDYSVNVTGLSNSEFDVANFSYYPNPVKNVLNLNYIANITEVKVYNLLGQEVASKMTNATDTQIDMSNLQSGSYLVKVITENQSKTISVLKN